MKIEVVKPSNHAVTARFDYGDTPFPGSSNAISHTPFGEYHAFANAPKPGESGYRLVISRAGDWTGRFIDNPPSHVWVKGITTSGVARIEVLFKKVVYVGTGSGIGPILPHLFAGEVPNRLIWSTRSPRKTYGALVDEVEASTENPLIWDTDLRGKPDLAALALQAVQENRCGSRHRHRQPEGYQTGCLCLGMPGHSGLRRHLGQLTGENANTAAGARTPADFFRSIHFIEDKPMNAPHVPNHVPNHALKLNGQTQQQPEDDLIVSVEGRVATIRINRPQVLNALNSQLMHRILELATGFDRDPCIRALIIAGSRKAFAAGADIAELSEHTHATMYEADVFHEWDRFADLRLPKIAASAAMRWAAAASWP